MCYYLLAVPSGKNISSTYCRTINSAFIIYLRPVSTSDKLPTGFFFTVNKFSLGEIAALSADILYKALSDCILAGPFIGHSMFRCHLQLNLLIRGLIHGAFIFLFIERLLLWQIREAFCFEIPTKELIGTLYILTQFPSLSSKKFRLHIVTATYNS